MPGSAGQNLGLYSGYAEGESGWGNEWNQNMRYLDTVVHLAVESVLSSPPASPALGDRFLVGASPTGAFATHAGKIAVWLSQWVFYTPKRGWRLAVRFPNFGGKFLHFTGVSWQDEQPVALSRMTDAVIMTGGVLSTPPGLVRRAYTRFNGLDQYIEFGTLPEFSGADRWTMWSRFRARVLTSQSDTDNVPVVFGGQSTPQIRLRQTNSQLSPVLTYVGGGSAASAINGVLTDTVYSAGVTYREHESIPSWSQAVTFLDTTKATPVTGPFQFLSPFHGARNYTGSVGNHYLDGDIFEIAVFNRGLSDDEIDYLAAGNSPDRLLPAGYWNFADRDGNTVPNRIAGGSSATLFGNPGQGADSDADAYIVGPAATDAWAGQEGKIAYRSGGAWAFFAPVNGMQAVNMATGRVSKLVGGTWVEEPDYIGDAPADTQKYARQDNGWTPLGSEDLFTRKQHTRPWRGAVLSLAAALTGITYPTQIQWTQKDLDTEGAFNVANPNRLTVPAGRGITKVRLHARVSAGASSATGSLHVSFQKNTENVAGTTLYGAMKRETSTGFSGNMQELWSPVLSVADGDYFAVRVNVNGLGSTPQPDATCYFEMEVLEAQGAEDDYPFDLGITVFQKPEPNEVLVRTVFPRAVDFAINFNGSQVKAGTAATNATSLSIRKNGTVVGQINFAAASDTGTITAGSATSFAVGDVLSITAPPAQDDTLADIAITFTGTRSM